MTRNDPEGRAMGAKVQTQHVAHWHNNDLVKLVKSQHNVFTLDAGMTQCLIASSHEWAKGFPLRPRFLNGPKDPAFDLSIPTPQRTGRNNY